ncbi:MAG: hypothetical protein K2P26_05905 [Oscillospiraceae bacterium]|nr:hypothetical protein [Oscillospiraceae bacterium]
MARYQLLLKLPQPAVAHSRKHEKSRFLYHVRLLFEKCQDTQTADIFPPWGMRGLDFFAQQKNTLWKNIKNISK